jgi:uncharacterized protein (TIGR03437 family)
LDAHRLLLLMVYRALITAGMVLGCAIYAAAQNPVSPPPRPMTLQQTRYEIRAGEPAQIAAPNETLDFLLNAKSRRVETAGTQAGRLVVGPSKTGGHILLAASLGTKPGEYTAKLSAASAAGEERTTTLTVVVKPRQAVPSGASRPPVVLLNGWETGFTDSCPVSSSSSDTFGNLAQYLVTDGVPIVYFFDNCVEDPNQAIETLGVDLANFLTSIKYDDGTQVPLVDLVCHSMGGLIARAYLAGLQPDETLTPPATTLVRDLVMIAVPNFGSFVAANYVNGIEAGTQDAELIPGSLFLWSLATWNQRGDDLRGVNAIAVIGNAGYWLPSLESATESLNASDGIVSLTSASLSFVAQQSSVTRIVPYCHIDPVAFTNTDFGTFACDAAGIANVTSQTQETGEIVRSFLAGTSDWESIGTTPATDPYLSVDGGMFFGMVNGTGSYVTDLTAAEWGTVQLLQGGDIDVIYYDDFISGTGDFDATSESLGTINCQTLAEAVGYYSAARCKIDTAIYTVDPLASAPGRVVNAGSTITINGTDFEEQCNGCKVTAIPAGSTTTQPLTVASWTNDTITADLPAGLTGLVTIGVQAVTGDDAINIMVVTPSATAAIAVSPSSLNLAYTVGGAVVAAQSLQITNTGTGTLAWSATASASWLSLSAASGTAPSTLSVSILPTSLTAGTYTGNIQISATGASNSPVTVAVTLTVTAAVVSLAVAPKTLTFNYASGGSIPAAQSISIMNAAWTASTSALWISLSAASGAAPATLSVSVNPTNMPAGTYTGSVQITAAGATGSPASVTVTLVVTGTQPAGSITALVNGASYQPGFAPATWVTIFGTNLSESTQTWQADDFGNGLLPTSLQGVSVTIDGLPAYVEYISPTQINVLAPDDAKVGAVQVQVTTAQQQSNSLTVQEQQVAPAFFTIDGGLYVAASHTNYTLVGKPNLLPGVVTQPAAPGEIIQMYGTGFGPTSPLLPTSQLVSTAAALATLPQVTIGGVAASVEYAGLVGAGLYQLNVTVPASLSSGDALVVATIGGVQSQAKVSITVQ